MAADHQLGRFASLPGGELPLTVGRRYVVMGMGIWETGLNVLVRDDDGDPDWFLIGLFDVDTQPIPAHWEFALDEGIRASGRDLWTRWVARWGYPELVRDSAHSDGLMELEPEALKIFDQELARRETEDRPA